MFLVQLKCCHICPILISEGKKPLQSKPPYSMYMFLGRTQNRTGICLISLESVLIKVDLIHKTKTSRTTIVLIPPTH